MSWRYDWEPSKDQTIHSELSDGWVGPMRCICGYEDMPGLHFDRRDGDWTCPECGSAYEVVTETIWHVFRNKKLVGSVGLTNP